MIFLNTLKDICTKRNLSIIKKIANMRVNLFGDFVVSDAANLLINDKLINIIKEADYNVVNFEASITHRKQHASIKSGPSISQSIDASRWLIEHKFNVISR